MENITPSSLKPGDRIGIIAPARKVTQQEIHSAIKFLNGKGFMVKTSAHLYASHHQFAGTEEQRATDFMDMIEDKSVKAILCARGGYGSIRLLDYMNFRKLQQNPKWIVGYSDITVFHGLLNGWYGIETIHGPMPFNFPDDGQGNESLECLINVLMGENPTYNLSPNPLNKIGKAEGHLIGGNLSILYSLSGTDADVNPQGKILFIEDLDEYLYHIDRMMMNLKYSGKLKSIAGLIVGGMTEMKDNQVPFGSTAHEIIANAMNDYNVPICFDFPAGHSERNLSLIMGRRVKLDVKKEGATITFEKPAIVQSFDNQEEP
ncbi:MAG TPA: LD-carboxypeptidase [Bacteroidales bacterium]|nr:LD-carboxypeptidase [Bacteroidales bacterium]